MKRELSRRELLALGAGAALGSSLRVAEASTEPPRTVVEANDNAVAQGMAAQTMARSHASFGGIPDFRELYLAGTAGRFVQQATAAHFCETSSYFGDARVLERIGHALSFLEREQSADGNIDLLTTNFNSPPDTGFVVHKVASAANIARIKGRNDILGLFRPFLMGAGNGMAKGGVHTPNHRWVVSAALAQINELFPQERFVNRIDAWLAEGIDIDEEGQFTERSTGGYNAVCDSAFVVMADKLKRPELLEPVRKNLNAMAYLLHPDGEIVTEFSNRQDRNTRATMDRYWFPLRYVAVLEEIGLYTSMLKPIEPHAMELALLMEYPVLNRSLPRSSPVPGHYELDLPRSGITRIRRGNRSITAIHQGNSRWLSVRNGEAVINGIRFASAFFGKGQFRPSRFVREGQELCFYQDLEGPYYQPFSNAEQLPVKQNEYGAKRRLRDVSEVCTLHYEGRLRETKRGLALTIRATGTEGVPLAIEINVRAGSVLNGTESLDNERHLLRDGTAEIRAGENTILLGPGFAEHRYVQIRGAEEKLSGPSIYLTAYTPLETTLDIQMP